MTDSDFTKKELQIIHDQDFLLTKKVVISKVHNLLEKTKLELQQTLEKSDFHLTKRTVFNPTKISKGENYRGLPYLVFDYPAFFSKEDIFAFRTMCWWGNFFSCTLHLQGKSLGLYRSKFLEDIDSLEKDKYYLCIGDSPWQYHFGEGNYKLITKNDLSFIEKCSFLKLSKRIELDKWKKLPAFSASCLSQFLKILNMK